MPRAGKGYWFDAKLGRFRIRIATGRRGQSVRETLPRGTSEAQAVQRAAQIRREVFDTKLGRRPDRLISEALMIYLEKARDFKGYEQQLNHVEHIKPWINGKRLSEIGEVAVAYRKFHRRKLSGSTINRRVAILRRCARIAWEELKWIDHPPKFEMVPEKPRNLFLTMPEVEALAAATKHQPTKDAILLAVCTGWRRGELWALTQDNVRGDMLYLPDSKNGEARVSPIHERIKEAVTRLPLPCSAHWVFVNFKKAAVEVGLPPELRFHDLRHTTASLIVNAGGSLKDVQEILGQKTAASANRYAHLHTARKKAVLEMALARQAEPMQPSIAQQGEVKRA